MDCEASARILLESMLLDASIEPTNIPLSLLKAITNNFSDDQKIGSGGFANVYKGLLQNGTIAVKKLLNIEVDEKKFTQEVDSLMRVKHKNVVRFLGYCADTQGKWSKLEPKNVMVEVRQRLLCFEFLPNGSLDQYISGASQGLEWKTRYQIIKGVCEGLHYLHKNSILHLDLKPGNILLNENMVPKIADFGLSRCFEEKQSRTITSKLIGTLGYMAPEFFSGVITFKLDIYSLGVIILEILTGEKGYAGVENVLEGWKTRFKTPQGDIWLEQIRVCAKIGTQCMDSDPEKRPITQRILETLDEIECIYGFIETDICASLVHKGSTTELQKATHVVPPKTSCDCEVGIRTDSCSSYSIILPETYHVVGKIEPAPASVTTPTAVGSFWKIRKYVLLLATLDASATYLAALSPPGGLWLDNDSAHLAGDPVLQVTYPLRYMVFFCSNVTAFIASIIAVTLLVQSLSRCRWWLGALQSAIIVDQLGLMGAYAAGSCRDMVMSAYVPLVAIMASSYVLVFALRVLRTRDVGRSVVPQLPQTVERARKDLLIFATLVVTVTYQVGLRTPGGFLLSDSQLGNGHHLAGDPMLLAHNPSRFMEFFYFNSTAFVASLVIIMHLMSKTATCYGFQSCALWVCTAAALIGLMGAVSFAAPRSIKIPIYVIALMAAIILYIGLQVPVLLCTPVENYWVHSVQETMQKFLKLDQSESQDQHGHAVSDPKTLNANQPLQKSGMCLLLLGILSVSVTYQVGLNPPGGFWQTNATDGLHYYLAGDPIFHITYPRRYLVFFFCNTTAFVASLVILILFLSNIFRDQGIKYCALRVAMIMDLLGLIGAYAAGSCRQVFKSVYISLLLVPVFHYVGIHILMFILQLFPNHATWREMVKEKLEKFLPKWLKKLLQLQTEEENLDQELKLEKTRKLVLLLSIVAASITYQAGMSPPGGICEENMTDHIVSNPVLSDNYQRRYRVFFYCNTTAFVASLASIMLLVNRRLSATGIQSHAIRVCVILGLFGIISAFVAGSCRKVSTSIIFFVLVFAVLICIALQVILVVSKSVQHLLLRFLSLFSSLEEESNVILHHTATVGGPRDLWGEKFPKYLLLLASLTAAVTYQSTMNPPGGLWDDGQTGYIAGDPVLLSSYPRRYKAFFYFNSVSFVTSLVVMVVLLLIKCVRKAEPAILALQTAMILNLFGLMGAYAAGSCRTVGTSAYILVLVMGVSGYIVVVLSKGVAKWLKRVNG